MDKGKAAARQGSYNVTSQEDAARNLASAVANVPDVGNWPEPHEVCRLGGHVNDVLLLQFSHDGQSIATGSKDGTIRVSCLLGCLDWCNVLMCLAFPLLLSSGACVQQCRQRPNLLTCITSGRKLQAVPDGK